MQLMAKDSGGATELFDQLPEAQSIDVQGILGMLVAAQQAHSRETSELKKRLDEQHKQIVDMREQHQLMVAQLVALMKPQMSHGQYA